MSGALFAVLFCVLLGVFATPPAAAAELKSTRGLCLECHGEAAAILERKHVHDPVGRGLCTSCHNPHASRHEKLIARPGSELCFNCHDQARGFAGEVVHKPVKEGKCLACHGAHSTEYAKLLVKDEESVCFDCHKKDELLKGAVVHPEVAKGNCSACHSPHSSDRVGLLVADRKVLCTGCHSMEGRDGHLGYNVAGTDCLGCHSPHSSDSSSLLRATQHKPFELKNCSACHADGSTALVRAGSALCVECHKASMDGFNRINSHLIGAPAGRSDNPCSNCHNPHASDGKGLLKDREDRLCYGCHADTKKYVAGSTHVHPDIVRCSDCHVSHGSNDRFFLSQGADTCSGCHASQGAFTHPVGDEIIDPRSKGSMTCTTCHNSMGAPFEPVLRLDRVRLLCEQCHQV